MIELVLNNINYSTLSSAVKYNIHNISGYTRGCLWESCVLAVRIEYSGDSIDQYPALCIVRAECTRSDTYAGMLPYQISTIIMV